jgi:hypothetical protein
VGKAQTELRISVPNCKQFLIRLHDADLMLSQKPEHKFSNNQFSHKSCRELLVDWFLGTTRATNNFCHASPVPTRCKRLKNAVIYLYLLILDSTNNSGLDQLSRHGQEGLPEWDRTSKIRANWEFYCFCQANLLISRLSEQLILSLFASSISHRENDHH